MPRWTRLCVAALAAGALCVTAVSSAVSAPPPNPHNDPSGPAAAGIGPAVIAAGKMQDLYTPIAPCRIVDTRSGTGTNGTPIGNQTRTYHVAGTVGFAPQGGKSGGCGIPSGATAVAATFTAVNPAHGGFLRAWPNGQSEPTATLLNYGTSSTGTGATVSISSGAAPNLTVHNYSGPTELVIDISGYYQPQIHAILAPSGGVYDGSPRVLSSENTGVGSYKVRLDVDATGCTAVASVHGGAYFASAYEVGQYIYANTYAPNGVGTNLYWSLTVVC